MHVARASLGNQPISGLELKPHGITKCTSLINLPDGKTSKQRPKTKCYGLTDESHFLWALDLGHNCYEHYVNDVSCSFFVCLAKATSAHSANDQIQCIYRCMEGFFSIGKLLSRFEMSGSDVTLDPIKLKETVGRFELVQQNVRSAHGVTFVSQVPDKLPSLTMTNKELELTRRGRLVQSLKRDGKQTGWWFLALRTSRWTENTPRNWRLYQLSLTPHRTLPSTLGTLELGASWFYVHNGLEPKPHHNNNGQIYQ